MHFAFTEEQLLIRSSFRDLLESSCTAACVRAAFTDGTGRVPALWGRLAEFGAISVMVPESLGGLGLGAIELSALLEESGRAALPEPLLEVAAIATTLLVEYSSDPRVSKVLERVVSDDSLALVSFEGSRLVPHADACDFVVHQSDDELHLVPQSSLSLVQEESVDRTRRLFRVSVQPGLSTQLIAKGPEVLRTFHDAFDRAALAASAELLGLASRALEMAIEYAKTRQQFGQPIGAFQAVKHHLANAHLGLAFARPLIYRAAHSLSVGDPDKSSHVSSAKAFTSEAAWQAARVALQVHGAIGYSYEHDLHLWMKRIWARAADYGDAAWHRSRVAAAVIGPET